jgi:uncharacterized protein (DUF433 family)
MHRNDYWKIDMSPASEMLKTTEAAVVSRVALRDVNRVIDEGILPEGFFTHDDGRLVLAAACTLISFYFESAKSLTSEERLFVIKVAVPRLRRSVSFELPVLVEVDWIIQHEYLTIDLAPFVRGAVERLGGLVRARRLVHSSSEILGGTPVVRGTRIPIYDVAASAAAGISTERILAAYPGLDAEKIELATIFAQANPPRGRPRTAGGELPTGAVIVSDHRRPRRKKAK